MIEGTRLYSILAQMGHTTVAAQGDRLDCFNQAVRLAQAAAGDFMEAGKIRTSNTSTTGTTSSSSPSTRYNVRRQTIHNQTRSGAGAGAGATPSGAVCSSLVDDGAPIYSSALSVHAAQLGTYLYCQLRTPKLALPMFELSEATMFPGMNIHARSRVWVRIVSYYLEMNNIQKAEEALTKIIVGQGHDDDSVATGGVMVLLALCVARLHGALDRFIEQQLDMEKSTGEIGGSSIGFRSTIFAASETGHLDWCHRALTNSIYDAKSKKKSSKKYNLIQVANNVSGQESSMTSNQLAKMGSMANMVSMLQRHQDPHHDVSGGSGGSGGSSGRGGRDGTNEDRMSTMSTFSVISEKSEGSENNEEEKEFQSRNSTNETKSGSPRRLSAFRWKGAISKVRSSIKVTKALRAGPLVRANHQPMRNSQMFDDKKSLSSKEVLGTLMGPIRMHRYSTEDSRGYATPSASFRISGTSALSETGNANEAPEEHLEHLGEHPDEHPLISLESPYDILNNVSSDPLLLSVVAHLCVRQCNYVTGMQISLVGLSYLDLDRPASMALPRFHAFCWCAVAGSMALFGLMGHHHKASLKSEILLTSTILSNETKARRQSVAGGTATQPALDRGSQLQNIMVYRQKLKKIVHRLVKYGGNVTLLKGYCLYMRGWWRMSRGFINKALKDWKVVGTTTTTSSITLTARVEHLIKVVKPATKKFTAVERNQFLKEVYAIVPVPGIALDGKVIEKHEDSFQEREESDDEEEER